MRTFPKAAFESQSRPLCRHYVLVLVEALAVVVEGDAGVENVRTLHWALGVLDDGQYDVFDAWSTPLTKTPDWQERFARLKDRGADRIDLVASRRSLIPQAELSAIYPNAKSLAAPDPLTPELLAASSHRRMARGWQPRLPSVCACNHGIDGALELQDRVQALASRSVWRHGRFTDELSAAAFALNALGRAEQRVVASDTSLKIPGWYRSSARRCNSRPRVKAVAF
jgi:hypothetical protein